MIIPFYLELLDCDLLGDDFRHHSADTVVNDLAGDDFVATHDGSESDESDHPASIGRDFHDSSYF
jgi:hypothetical protein